MPPSTNATVSTRPATPADLPAINAIYADAVLHTVSTWDYEPMDMARREAWFAAHEREGLPVFVAVTEAGTVLGWSALNQYNHRPGYRFTVENSVYVGEPHQGRGLGRRLLAALIEAARELGMHSIVAAIDGENEASVRLHRAFGFEPAGRVREAGFKFDRWLDVVYLQLLL
ncbi:MAG: N-acetyltransferase [Verrucomicrobiales bacterium]|nr:N-acetyltransferase [Verrucomicrobiales bacterium]